MIDLIYLLLSLLSFSNIEIKGFNSFFYEYLYLDNCNSVRGIFVWMIFFRHYSEYYSKNINKISIKIDNSFGQNIVSMFLFYSGYGINESFKKKGCNYFKTLPIKSLIIFIKSEIIIFIFLCNNLLLGKKITLNNYFNAIIFKDSIGNSYWFSFTIIMLYIYAFFSFIFIKKRFNLIGIIIISIICFFHII